MKYFVVCLIILVLLCVIFVFVSCAAEKNVTDKPVMENSYTQIDQKKAKEMMAKDDGHVILDVRRIDEYIGGHIPGAVCIPNEEIGSERPEALPDPDQIILVYCRSGRRSKEAAQKLFDMGYTNVYEFGGVIEWTGELVKGESPDAELPAADRSKPVLVVDTGKKKFYAVIEDNPSAEEFISKLKSEKITVSMKDYGGFEKVGNLPWKLQKSDKTITTEPGDIILYQGSQITIYYDKNTWSFTRLAKIGNTSKEELLEALGDSDALVTFSLEWSE